MTSVTYPHFCVEHVEGHHRNVGTPADPATARLGESVYRFVPRSVLGGLASAWRIERRRAARLGLRRWSWRDRRVRMGLLTAALYAAVALAFGWAGVLFFAAQSAVAVGQLEVINYLEHYGLSRREVGPGRYERVGAEHSWESAHRLTAWYLFNLPRHADHHARASRPYWNLDHSEASPQLPWGYSTVFLMALVPPLWRRVMDPRVPARSRGDRPLEEVAHVR